MRHRVRATLTPHEWSRLLCLKVWISLQSPKHWEALGGPHSTAEEDTSSYISEDGHGGNAAASAARDPWKSKQIDNRVFHLETLSFSWPSNFSLLKSHQLPKPLLHVFLTDHWLFPSFQNAASSRWVVSAKLGFLPAHKKSQTHSFYIPEDHHHCRGF